jgi:hypothetical protein
MHSVNRNGHVIVAISFLLLAAPLFSQAKADQGTTAAATTGDLQKAAQNPVAGLISVPIQDNSNFDIGPNSEHRMF